MTRIFHPPSDGIALLPDSPGIYAIFNRCTRRVGVGLASRSIRGRVMTHRSNLRRQRGLSAPLARDLLAWGIDSFVFIALECVPTVGRVGADRDRLRTRESWWADQLGALDERTGYNFEAGGMRSPASLFREHERKLMRSNSRRYRLLPGVTLDDPIQPTLLESWWTCRGPRQSAVQATFADAAIAEDSEMLESGSDRR